jgi:hypothetical protein
MVTLIAVSVLNQRKKPPIPKILSKIKEQKVFNFSFSLSQHFCKQKLIDTGHDGLVWQPGAGWRAQRGILYSARATPSHNDQVTTRKLCLS